MRAIGLFLAALLGYFVVKRLNKMAQQAGDAHNATFNPQQAPERLGGPMVQCQRCGVHIPEAEAAPQGDLFICREGERCSSVTQA